jgi:hypothetical protein
MVALDVIPQHHVTDGVGEEEAARIARRVQTTTSRTRS